MSKIKEQRIVEMKFQNKDFQAKAKQSMDTLDELEGKLKFEGAQKGAKNLNNALNSINVDKLNEALDKINYRFSTVGITMTTMLQKAVGGLGSQISNIFTTIKQKGTARALNLEKARFLLNGITQDAQKTADIINGPVNEAVSGTRFGLDEAALSASTLFASGVTDTSEGGGLEKSLKAIATAATMTNTEFSEMAHIFSTVKSNGRIMTEQIRQFNFRGLNMYQELAKVYGTTEAAMTEMVSKGKIGYNDLIEAMQHFGDVSKKANETYEGALSNVKAALGRIGVLYEADRLEATRRVMVALIDGPKAPLNAFKSSLENAAGILGHMSLAFADTTAKALKSVEVFNMMTNSGESLRYVMTALWLVSKDLKEGFKDIYPEGMLGVLEEISEGFKLVAFSISGLIVSIKYTALFKAFFRTLKTLGTIFKSTFAAVSPLIDALAGAFRLLGETVRWLSNRWINALDALEKFGVIEALADVINAVLTRLIPTGDAFVAFGQKVRTALTKILPGWGEYNKILPKFAEMLHKLAAFIRGDGAWIGDALKGMFSGVDKAVKPVDTAFTRITLHLEGLKKVTDSVCKGIHSAFAAIFGTIGDNAKKNDGLFNDINFSLDGIGVAFTKLGDILKKVWPYIREVMLWIFNYKVADGAQKIGKGVEGIGKAFSSAGDLIKGFGEKAGLIDKKKSPVEKVFDAMKKLAVSVLILASAMWIVSKIPKEDFDRSVEAIISFIVVLSAAIAIAKKLGLMDNKVVASFGMSMLLIAFAMRGIARAMQIISKIPIEDMDKVKSAFWNIVAAVGVLTMVMGIASRISGIMKEDVITRMGVCMLLMANAMLVMSVAIGIMAFVAKDSESFDKAVNALLLIMVTIGALTAVIGIVGYFEGAAKTILAAGVAIGLIAFSMLSFAAAIAILGLLPVEIITQGLESLMKIFIMMGVFVAAMEIASRFANSKAIYGAAAAILALAVAINLLVTPIGILGAMKPEQLTQGLSAVVVAIIAIGTAITAISAFGRDAASILAAGAAILIISAAIVVLGVALQTFAQLAADDHLLSSMTAFVIALAAMTAALILLQGESLGAIAAAGALLILSAAIVVFAAAMYIMSQCDMGKVAIGMLILAAAFAAFIAVCVVLAPVILAAVPVMLALAAALGAFALVAVIAGVALIAIGKGLELCAKGIKAFNGADPTYAIEALKAFASSFSALEVIALGAIAAEILMMGGGLAMISVTGAAAAVGLTGFAKAMNQLLALDVKGAEQTIARLANSFLNFKSSANNVRTMADVTDLLAASLYSMLNTIPQLSYALDDFTFQLQDAAKAWAKVDFQPFIDQIGQLAIAMNQKIIGQLHQFVSTGKYIVDGIKMGIAEKQQEVYNAGFALGNAVNQGVMDALDINSPSKEMIKNGRYAGEGLMIGTEEYNEVIRKQGIKLGNSLILGVRNSTSGGSKDFRNFLNGVSASMRKFVKSQKLGAYSNLANQLYLKSDEYKDAVKDLKEYYKEYNKVYKQSQEDLKKTKEGSEDDRNRAINAYNQDIDSLNEIESKIAEVGKKIERGPKQAFDKLYKSIRDTVKSMLSISNLNVKSLFNGLDKMEFNTNLGNTKNYIDGLRGSLKEFATVAKSTTDAYDLLNVSYDTGINLLERFGKVSSMTVRRLMINAKSQLKAYKEFRDGIDRMRQMGLSEDLVDAIEAKGPQALGEVRSFLKMGYKDIAEYNSLWEEQKKYEAEALERNMQKEVDKYTEFYNDLEELAARGLSAGIIKRLKDGGVEKAAFVKALLGLDSFENVEQWYADSVEAVNEATSTEKEINETFSTLSEWFDYNTKKNVEWNSQLETLQKAGIDSRILQIFKDMGSESGQALVDAAIREIGANPQNVKKINDAYAALGKSQKDPAKVMLENLSTSNDTVSAYHDNMDKLAKKLKKEGGRDSALYREIEAMGTEAGGEYAAAFIAADKETQKAIIAEMKEREKLEQEEIQRQWQRKLDQILKWKEASKKIAELRKAGKINKSLANELISMGPEYAYQLDQIANMDEKELEKFSKRYGNALKNVPKDVATSVTDSMAQVAGTATESFANVLSEKNVSSITKEALKGIDSNSNKSAAKSGGKSVGTSASDGLSTGLSKGTDKAMSKWSDKLSKGILNIRNDKSVNSSLETLAKYINNKFGIDLSPYLDNKKTIRTTSTAEKAKDKNKAKQTLKESQMESRLKGAGVNLGLGIPAGMGSKEVLDATKTQAGVIIDTAKAAAQKKGQIKSPSRLMANEVGKYLTLGIAAGMLEHTSELTDTTNKLMTDLETSLVDSVNGIQNGVNPDFSINLVPNTASIDFSKNIAQASQIQDIFSSISGVNFEIGRDANKDVVAAIDNMRGDFQNQFNTLSNTIEQMQLVMDTGALVGQIANPMNQALGQQVALAQRGVTA